MTSTTTQSYYTKTGRRYPRVTRKLLEAIAAHPSKAPTSQEVAEAIGGQAHVDRTRNMLARLRARLLVRSHSRPQVWVLTKRGHEKLAWLRAQDPGPAQGTSETRPRLF